MSAIVSTFSTAPSTSRCPSLSCCLPLLYGGAKAYGEAGNADEDEDENADDEEEEEDKDDAVERALAVADAAVVIRIRPKS